jgi:hypothetical protein
VRRAKRADEETKMSQPNPPVTQQELDAFVATAQGILTAHMDKWCPNCTKPTLTATLGSKFIRVVRSEGENHRSVYCFIASQDGSSKTLGTYKAGDILKSASWTTPARHARGNIRTDTASLGPFGAAYRR